MTYNEFYTAFIERAHQAFPVCHRGYYDRFSWLPENSLEIIKSSIDRGYYFMEIDIQQTRDGQLVLMHDETIDRMTTGTGAISELTLAEIQSYWLYEYDGSTKTPTTFKVPSLREVLVAAKGKGLFNIDKGWEYRKPFYDLLVELDCFETVIIKSEAPTDEIADFLKHANPRFQYMHKIFDRDVQHIDSIHNALKPLVYELSFFDLGEAIVQPHFIERLKQKSNVWINALNVSKNAGHNDELALINPDLGWGTLLNFHPQFIQTDYASEYVLYRNKKNITMGINSHVEIK